MKRSSPIGPRDFYHLNRIVRLAATVGERLRANGHTDLARKLADASLIVAEVDGRLASDALPTPPVEGGSSLSQSQPCGDGSPPILPPNSATGGEV